MRQNGRDVSRRGFLRLAGGTLLSAPLVAGACATAATPEPAAPTATTAAAAPEPTATTAPATSQRPAVEMSSAVIAASNPNYITMAPFILARDLGYYAEEGIESVEVINTDEVVPGLLGGSIHLADIDTFDVVNAVFNEDLPLRLVACFRDRETNLLGVAPEIKQPADLKGKNAILGDPGSRLFELRREILLKWSNGEVDAATDMSPIVVSGGSDAWNQALLSGQAAVVPQFSRHVRSILDAGGQVIFAGYNNYPQEIMAATVDFINNNPNTLRALLRAQIRGYAFLFDWENKDRVIEIMRAADFTVRDQHIEAQFANQESHAWYGMPFKMEDMDIFLQLMERFKVVERETEYGEMSDLRALWDVQRELYGYAWPPPKDESLTALFGIKPA